MGKKQWLLSVSDTIHDGTRASKKRSNQNFEKAQNIEKGNVMYRQLISVFFGGSIVAIMYEPITGMILFGLFLLLAVSTALLKIYQNRIRPIPKIIAQPPEVVQQSALEREMEYVASRYRERALNNGYQTVESIPEKLKI